MLGKSLFSSRFIWICLTLFFVFPVFSQDVNYSRVTVFFDTEHKIEHLARTGIDLTHGKMIKGVSFTTDLSSLEILEIRKRGFDYEIDIPDVQEYYVKQLAEYEANQPHQRNGCEPNLDDEPNYQTPEHFSLGSMGGYYTYEEMVEQLDLMHEEYPDLITQRHVVDGVATHDGNPIFWLRLSQQPDIDNPDKPEVLYTALHHAREPLSLTQMIYYMWFLLEHYETNEQVSFLVDESEMYFMPCLNPDGYIYNQINNPNGGGMWRKNRRDNENGTWGVDLNRNYDYEWGHDDVGSSPETDNQTYRGPFPFSEPETQAVRQFCEAHDFRLALNYHTYGDLLIYPWGYSDTPSQDSSIFFTLSGLLTTENDYRFGTGSQTVGYTVNGCSDDWMYGEREDKGPIWAFTPEVGPAKYGFWPPVSEIEPLCKEVVRKNINAVYTVHNFGVAVLSSDPNLPDRQGIIQIDLQQYGLSGGDLEVAITSNSSLIQQLSNSKTTFLDFGENTLVSFDYVLSPSAGVGEQIPLEIHVNNGRYTSVSVVEVQLNPQETLLVDDGTDLNQWITSGIWGLSDSQYKTPPFSFTDSPGRNYPYSSLSAMEYDGWLDLTQATSAYVRYWTKFNINEDGDFAQIEVSTTGSDWIALCGNYTEDIQVSINGTIEPAYTGQQETWVLEQVDLSGYIGQEIRIRFKMKSGSIFNEGDGIYIDDIDLKVFLDELTSNQALARDKNEVIIFPIPAQAYCFVEGADRYYQTGETINYRITDVTGRIIKTAEIQVFPLVRLSVAELPSGAYILELGDQVVTKLLIGR